MATNDALNNSLAGQTGTGQYVGDNSPTLVTPNIGAATGTSINLSTSTTINGFIDDDTMATASNTTGATSESIKAYVDSQVTGGESAKAWVSYNQQTPAILDSFNVTSVTDSSAGQYVVNFTTPFAALNWCCASSLQAGGAGNNPGTIETTFASSSASSASHVTKANTSAFDAAYSASVYFGDQ